MATYSWSVPTGNIITGSTYIKDTDNKIQDTMNDLADFVNSLGAYTGQGLLFDYVDKASNQTITGIKTFSNGIISNVTGNVTGTVSGNSGTTTKLATARTITLAGDVTGSVSFDGSANASITTTVGDDSHNHSIAYIAGLQTALDGKLSTSGNAASATYATNSGYSTNAGNADTVDGYHASTLLNNYDNAHSFTTNGYQKLANGLTFQWGYFNGGGTVSFPISFATSCLNVSVTEITYGINGSEKVSVSSIGTSSFVATRNATSGYFYWFAIGY